MACERGSMWRIWDFHVHTPYSILNNNFGVNADDETEFDDYVVKLFTAAISHGVSAIGITDYFSVDGYKRIKTDYLANTEKMKSLFPDQRLYDSIQNLYVFPNVELRLNTFVGENNHSVNYHVLFSDDVSLIDIEQNFLNCLKCNGRTLTKENIASIGREYKSTNPEAKGSNYRVGLEKVTVDYKEIKETLDSGRFAGKYLVAVPVDEDLSRVSWNGRDYIARKEIYEQADCLLTANEKTRKWALAKGEEANRISEFRSIKPCVWGSDAHNYDSLFAPANDKFCWLKCELSFEGLKQILYEPEERVKIQKEIPQQKDSHYVIDEAIIENEDFQAEPILFNENLTCIIGGKSTGKSLLLRHIAKAIDPDHVKEREGALSLRSSKFDDMKITVRWQDGTSDGRSIVYIPQSWLNRVVDDGVTSNSINQIIMTVLCQEHSILSAKAELHDKVEKALSIAKSNISAYSKKRDEISKLTEELNRDGKPEMFESTIDSLTSKRASLSEGAGISAEEIEKYNELETTIQNLKDVNKELKNESASIEFLSAPTVLIKELTTLDFSDEFVSDYSNLPLTGEMLEDVINKLTAQIAPQWATEQKKVQDYLEKLIGEKEIAIAEAHEKYNPLKDKIEKNDQLINLDNQIKIEREKLQTAKERVKKLHEAKTSADNLKSLIISTRSTIESAYADYCAVVNSKGKIDGSELQFFAEVTVNNRAFFDKMVSVFDNRNFTTFRSSHRVNLSECTEDFNISDETLESIWEAMMNPRVIGGLSLKTGNTVESVLQQMFVNWYDVRYIVKSGNDTIDEMSPGKKALVLLELLINLADAKCPILIDQPEDDLDNRSIYYDLVQYIKQKKHERQIIVVTHNANIVLGADAEEVIIANQEGKDAGNRFKRFEYRSGAIENDEVVVGEDGNVLPGVLNQNGIQTQICDILEGGKTAFELRKNKYFKSSVAES